MPENYRGPGSPPGGGSTETGRFGGRNRFRQRRGIRPQGGPTQGGGRGSYPSDCDNPGYEPSQRWTDPETGTQYTYDERSKLWQNAWDGSYQGKQTPAAQNKDYLDWKKWKDAGGVPRGGRSDNYNNWFGHEIDPAPDGSDLQQPPTDRVAELQKQYGVGQPGAPGWEEYRDMKDKNPGLDQSYAAWLAAKEGPAPVGQPTRPTPAQGVGENPSDTLGGIPHPLQQTTATSPPALGKRPGGFFGNPGSRRGDFGDPGYRPPINTTPPQPPGEIGSTGTGGASPIKTGGTLTGSPLPGVSPGPATSPSFSPMRRAPVGTSAVDNKIPGKISTAGESPENNRPSSFNWRRRGFGSEYGKSKTANPVY